MRTGVMGGTFNPPHMGHINAARAAKSELELHRLIFIPTGVPPHKQMAAGSPSSADRLEMTRIAARIVDAEVSDIEILREGKSFTVDTLREIKNELPKDELWLIMGTDMFLTIESWREPQTIFELVNIAAVPRDKNDLEILRKHGRLLKEKYGAVSRIIETEAVTISSSELRPDINSNGLLEFLPEEVRAYIAKNKLYGISGSDKF